MATGREHTPEQRFDLTSEARELVQNGAAAGIGAAVTER